jgi:hypothetical protein
MVVSNRPLGARSCEQDLVVLVDELLEIALGPATLLDHDLQLAILSLECGDFAIELLDQLSELLRGYGGVRSHGCDGTFVSDRDRNKGSKERVTNLSDPTLKGFVEGIDGRKGTRFGEAKGFTTTVRASVSRIFQIEVCITDWRTSQILQNA